MKLTLVEKKDEGNNVISFYFKPETQIIWRAGQFMQYLLESPTTDERGARRFFTIASALFEQNIMVTTRFSDQGSAFKNDLKKLEVGSLLEAQGPFGSFIVEDPNLNYVFIAGGIGITPFRSILLDLDHKGLPINVILLYANRDNNIVFKELFDNLASKHPSFKVQYIIDPQKIDERVLRTTDYRLPTTVYYVSGPAPMVKSSEDMLEGMGVSKDNIKHDYFPGYSEI